MLIHIVFCLAKDSEKIVAEKKIIQIQITIYELHVRIVGENYDDYQRRFNVSCHNREC
jgi:hypothetical protein